MNSSLDLASLRDIGLAHDTVQAALATPRPDDARLARVVEAQRDHVLVHDGRSTHRALVWPALRVALELERDSLVVGDWVWWQPLAAPDGLARGWVATRVRPRNRMTRRDPEGGRQPLVSNVDVALLVMGLDHDFNLRRLDRFLVLAHAARAEAVVVLTKADACADPAAAVGRTREHAGAALPVLAVDGRRAAACEALGPWIARGRTLVTLGSSGAGKTTLGNTLTGAAAITGAVRPGDGRGMHTTTVRTLRPLPGGACLIDTPGLRQLRLDADDDAVRGAFSEIVQLSAHCRFRNCRHDGEPGCAVQASVPQERLRSFQKLLRENHRDDLDVLQRHRRQADYKRRTREARERIAEKGR
jgi:ribosome biogenesis GTPase